jgi:hypothetical protein
VSGRRRIQATHKDYSKKVIVKFIWKESLKWDRLKGEKDRLGFKVEMFIKEVLPLGLFGLWDDFLGWVIALLRGELPK